MNVWALVIGVLVGLVLIRALVIRSASPGGGALRRDEEPMIYWFIVVVLAAMTVFLFWKGISGSS